MKSLVLALMLSAAALRADTNPQLSNLDATVLPSSNGADTYALASASPTVRSSMVDMAGYAGVLVGVTGNALVEVLWAGAADNSGKLPSGGTVLQATDHKFLAKKARYMGFRVLPTAAQSYSYGPTPTASVFYTLLAAQGSTIAPAHVTSLTLTGATTWASQAFTYCAAQPCTALITNFSSTETLLWWMDQTAGTPAYQGISMSAGAIPILLDATPNDILHWRYSASTGNGALQLRY